MVRPAHLRALLAAAALAVSVCSASGQGVDPRPLVFVGDRNIPPLSFVEGGEAKGLAVDVAQAIGRVLGRPVRLDMVDLADAKQLVLEGRADAIIVLSDSAEREEEFDFSTTVVTRMFGIFVRTGTVEISDLASLKGKRVGAMRAGIMQEILRTRPDITIVPIATYEDGFDRLLVGSIDAMAADQWVAAYTIQRRGIDNIIMAGPPFGEVGAGLAVKKGNLSVRSDINRALATLEASGELGQIRARWQSQQMVFMTREQQQRWIYMSIGAVAVVLLGAMGVWVLLLKRNIVAQTKLNAALRASEDRFAKAFDASPDCIAISDENGIVTVNDSFERISGYSKEFIIGRNIVESGMLIDPQQRARILEQLRETGSVRDFRWDARTKSGEFKTMLMSAQRMDINGRFHFLSVNRDITDQLRAEEALRHTEARYRELVENANDIIFTVDRDGYCLSMNRVGQEITGYVAPAGSRGTNLRQLVAPEELATVLSQLQRVMNGEDVLPFEIDILRADGRRTTLEVGVRPIREGGEIMAAQGIARDVTTRRELESQLRQAQKMDAIGRLAAGVAHDFNNLLTVVLAHCEASAPIVPEPHPLYPAMTGIRVAAERAAALTGQLLAFSRRQVTQPRALNVNDVVSDIKTMLTRLIGEDIEMRFRHERELWTVNADAGQLQQVVLNLAVNGRDAMPRGGQLSIETKNVVLDGEYVQHHAQVPPGEYVMIGVSDSGAGMDQETLGHIFEPFFTTKEVGKGTGLGLATVYGIVKQSGGFIWVYSEVGIGTTFKIYLPRFDAERPASKPAPIKRDRVVATGSETVMLVEDESDLREILEHYLAGKGYAVMTASDGPSCLAACAGLESRPRLLITDVVMPGMSGRTLADTLRADDPSMKVLYLSGYTDDAVLRHGILPSDTHFLQKPFALHELADKVRQILDTAQVPVGTADLN